MSAFTVTFSENCELVVSLRVELAGLFHEGRNYACFTVHGIRPVSPRPEFGLFHRGRNYACFTEAELFLFHLCRNYACFCRGRNYARFTEEAIMPVSQRTELCLFHRGRNYACFTEDSAIARVSSFINGCKMEKCELVGIWGNGNLDRNFERRYEMEFKWSFSLFISIYLFAPKSRRNMWLHCVKIVFYYIENNDRDKG